MKKDKLIGNIVIALMLVSVATVFIVPFVLTRQEREIKAELKHNPEQSAQVEVVSKRVIKERRRRFTTRYTYIVTFEFSDGSAKEVEVDRNSTRGNPITELYNFIYDTIDEGDTGILTYKEIENIEVYFENENLCRGGRKFISFEKDQKYGGMKLDMRIPDNNMD